VLRAAPRGSANLARLLRGGGGAAAMRAHAHGAGRPGQHLQLHQRLDTAARAAQPHAPPPPGAQAPPPAWCVPACGVWRSGRARAGALRPRAFEQRRTWALASSRALG
jgi:hypothetical protein